MPESEAASVGRGKAAAKRARDKIEAAKKAEVKTAAAKGAEVETAAAKAAKVKTAAAKKAEVKVGAAKEAKVKTAAAKKAEVKVGAAKEVEVETAATEGAEVEIDAAKGQPNVLGTILVATGDRFGGKLNAVENFNISDQLRIHHDVTAGIDVHKAFNVVTVQWGNRQETRTFRNLKGDSRKLARWLASCGVTAVLIESTGIYWKSLYDILRNHNINASLVNARHIRRFNGEKTDVMDSKGLATLAKLNVMRGSRVLEKHFYELRQTCRFRKSMVKEASAWKNRTEKALTGDGFCVSKVVTDIFGTTGQIIIEGLLDGLDVDGILKKIDDLVGYRLKAPREMLNEALEGEMSDQLKCMVRSCLDMVDILKDRAAQLEAQIEVELYKLGYEPVICLLQTHPGISKIGAIELFLELGCDLSDFKNGSKLSSWAGVCPGNNESGGKRLSSRTTGGNIHLKRILCEIANAAVRTKCYYQARYQGLRRRKGHSKAIIAIAHKILRVVYAMITKSEVYEDRLEEYEVAVDKKRLARWQMFCYAHGRRATALARAQAKAYAMKKVDGSIGTAV